MNTTAHPNDDCACASPHGLGVSPEICGCAECVRWLEAQHEAQAARPSTINSQPSALRP